MPFADLPTGARLHYIDTAPDDADKPVALLVHGMLGDRKSTRLNSSHR